MKDSPVEIVVVGSANLDLVIDVDHHPTPGQTVMGGDLRQVPGGKGANQATAAARLGRRTALVGCVGDDDAGQRLRRSLQDGGVDLRHLETAAVPTGVALITVADDGDNTIVVSPGANRMVDASHIGRATPTIADAPMLLLQLEVPLATVTAAAQCAEGRVVLNPAPAPDGPLPHDLCDAVDILVPNETELAALTGVDPAATPDALARAARTLGIDVVVITLGARGALLVTATDHQLRPAPRIEPVDTTAAGDAFCAALVDRLLDAPSELAAAVDWAVRVGAATTLRPGAAPSLPTRHQVEPLLAESGT